MIAVFDTNIVIDALNGVPEADAEYGRYDRVLISNVTWLEILSGADEDDALLRDFLEAHFQIIPLDLAIADEALHLRREFRLRLPDAIIWGTARHNDASLVTRNTRDFNLEWEGIHLPYTI